MILLVPSFQKMDHISFPREFEFNPWEDVVSAAHEPSPGKGEGSLPSTTAWTSTKQWAVLHE